MNLDIKIRIAELIDITALEKIKPLKQEGYFERCFQEQEQGKRTIFIAEYDNLDVGYGMLNFCSQYALYKRLDFPEIQDLNVLSDARCNGVGRALITHCEFVAKQEGKQGVGISVGLYSDYGAAQILYAKLGYLPDGNGISYDRQGVTAGEMRPIDDALCLMMIKSIS